MKESMPMTFEHKRIQNPPQINCYDEAERRADYEAHSGRHYIWPSSVPPKETRVPLYRFYVSDDDELYFVNDSEEVIDRVSYATGGFQTCDDDVVTVDSPEDGGHVYLNVLPHEGVKIDEYDMILDSDFLLQPQVTIYSASMGERLFLGSASKGGFSGEVLLWSGEEQH